MDGIEYPTGECLSRSKFLCTAKNHRKGTSREAELTRHVNQYTNPSDMKIPLDSKRAGSNSKEQGFWLSEEKELVGRSKDARLYKSAI